MKLKEVKAYKCPFCDYYSLNESDALKHAKRCPKNPNYTQECLHCHCLERDFEMRILYPNSKLPYCCCFHSGGNCMYQKHTNKELMKYIDKEKKRLTKYGIVENDDGKLVWE